DGARVVEILEPATRAAEGDDRARSRGCYFARRPGRGLRVPSCRHGVCGFARCVPSRLLRRLLRPSGPPARDLGTVLRVLNEGRPPLHPLRLLRDVSLPGALGVTPGARGGGRGVLRAPRAPDGR